MLDCDTSINIDIYLFFFPSFFHEQGEPDICCHTSLLCAAGTAGGVCSQRRACSSGGRDRNWEDFHCPTPGQSHRSAQEPSLAVPPSLLESTCCPEFQIMPDVHKYRVLSIPVLIEIFLIVCTIQDTGCGLWTWTSRVTLPICLEGEWHTSVPK